MQVELIGLLCRNKFGSPSDESLINQDFRFLTPRCFPANRLSIYKFILRYSNNLLYRTFDRTGLYDWKLETLPYRVEFLGIGATRAKRWLHRNLRTAPPWHCWQVPPQFQPLTLVRNPNRGHSIPIRSTPPTHPFSPLAICWQTVRGMFDIGVNDKSCEVTIKSGKIIHSLEDVNHEWDFKVRCATLWCIQGRWLEPCNIMYSER